MKKKANLKLLMTAAGVLLFNYLFWMENLGLNLVLFVLFLISSVYIFEPEARTNKLVHLTAIGTLIASVFVVYHNSGMAKFTVVLSQIIFIGFVHFGTLKSIMYSIISSVTSFFLMPVSVSREVKFLSLPESSAKRLKNILKLVVIPLGILFVFYLIFLAANPVFAKMSGNFWNAFGNMFEYFFDDLTIAKIMFLVFGIALVAWTIFGAVFPFFQESEAQRSNDIDRNSIKAKFLAMKKRGYRFKIKMNALKNEFRSVLILLVLINLLVLLVNVIDINSVWFNFQYKKGFNLSQFVHEGTYLLILSVLLSMAIIMIYFRKNLNFYPANKWLIRLSVLWIIQNAILIVSVAIRNFHYIHFHGLAYKRIGVFIFLVLVTIGLGTMIYKLYQKKSSYYLFRVNTWTVYASFIFMSIINWDGVIAKHNLSHWNEEELDWSFLLSLSDKTLPILYEHKNQIPEFKYDWYRNEAYLEILEDKKKAFLKRKKQTTWCSWNYSEDIALEYFKENKRTR